MRTQHTLAAMAAAVLLCLAVGCSSGSSHNDASTGAAADSGATASQQAGPSATVPDGWPSELALPSNVTVVESFRPDATSMTVVGNIDGDTQAVYDTLKTQLTSAGYDLVGSTFTPSPQGGYGSISAKSSQYTAAIAFGPDATASNNQVTISVAAVGT